MLNTAVRTGQAAAPIVPLQVDADLRLEDINTLLVREIGALAPFGLGNPVPLFSLSGVRPERVEQFGKTNDHLKLTFTHDGGRLEAIAFFATPNSFLQAPKVGAPCTLLANVEESHFAGRTSIRLRIVDVLPYTA
jgi:single-stranded-DNA-specific exonuclease